MPKFECRTQSPIVEGLPLFREGGSGTLPLRRMLLISCRNIAGGWYQLQSGNLAEFFSVEGDQRILQVQCGSGDYEIVRTDDAARRFKLCPNPGMYSGDGKVKIDDGNRIQVVFNHTFSLCLSRRRVRPFHSVKQFGCGNRGDEKLFIRIILKKPAQLETPPFRRDQDGGIQNHSHFGCNGGRLSLAEKTSLANNSASSGSSQG